MRKGLRRIISLTLIMVMMLSSMSFADFSTNFDAEKYNDNTRNEGSFDQVVSEKLYNLALEPKDDVRIFVELKQAPLSQRATIQGVKVSELSVSTTNTMKTAIYAEQTKFESEVQSEFEGATIHRKFDAVLNGMSMTVKYEDIEKIAAMDNVKYVGLVTLYERPRPVENMNNSSKLTNSIHANQELGFRGEGTIVSVIDSGIDQYHMDFQLDPSTTEMKLTEAAANFFITTNKLKGKYFTEKIPYGYNYADEDQEIRDLGEGASMHGMHVGGTVAADGQLTGVAPDAQVLAMKVFSNDPTFPYVLGDDIIAAINDSMILGADVINMSLGATALNTEPDDPEQMAVTAAANAGIVVSISAGNSAFYGNPLQPYAINPDIGVVGAPSLVAESLSVASVDNYQELMKHVFTVDGIEGFASFEGYGKDNFLTDFELVAIGGNKLGGPECYEGLDVTGKVVLVSRGSHRFDDKTKWAAEAGAIGIILYNEVGRPLYRTLGGWDIPFIKITLEDGQSLEAILAQHGSLNITGGPENYVDPNTGQLSDFSSWGFTPELGFKPDISAPGGNIFSLANNNGYQYMSGTSMAAPHAAGGAALVVERLKEDENFKNLTLTNVDRMNLAKNILMNTAVPIEEEFAYTSPRGQGAGLMDLERALTTNAVLVDESTGLAKINFGEFDENFAPNTANVTLTLTNYSNENQLYELVYIVQSQIALNGINVIDSVVMSGTQASITVDGSEYEGAIMMAPKSSASINISFDFTNTKAMYLNQSVESLFPNGGFLEGFIFAKPAANVFNVYKSNVDLAQQAVDTNADEIKKLSDRLLELEGEIKEKKQSIIDQGEVISGKETLVTEQGNAITLYKDENAESVADVLKLLDDISKSDKNLNDALSAFETVETELLTLARDYSLNEMLQGNHDFLSNLYQEITFDDDDIFKWEYRLSESDIADFYSTITNVISVLSDYEALVNTLTLDEYLTLTVDERADLVSQLRTQVGFLQEKLNEASAILTRARLSEYKDVVDNTLLPKMKSRIDGLQTKIDEATDESVKEKLIIVRNYIQSLYTYYTDASNKAAKGIAFNAKLDLVITLNNNLLNKIDTLEAKALIYDNAKASTDLFKASYDKLDLTNYDVYLEGLKELETELQNRKDAVQTEKDRKTTLESQLKTLEDEEKSKKVDKSEKEGNIKTLAANLTSAKEAYGVISSAVDAAVELSIPFVGFEGEWDQAPAFDAPTHSLESFYGHTGYDYLAFTAEGPEFAPMEKVSAFSPNLDGYKDLILPKLSVLRNVTDVSVSILDENGNELRILEKADFIRKHFFDYQNPQFKYFAYGIFDGTVDGEFLPEGNYYLSYEGKIATGAVHELNVPFMIDVTKPQVSSTSYNNESGIFSIEAKDFESGIKTYNIYKAVDVEGSDDKKPELILDNITGIFDLSEYKDEQVLYYEVEDYAGNYVFEGFQLVDYAVPEVVLDITSHGIYDVNTINYTGEVRDMFQTTLKIDSEVIELVNDGNKVTFTGQLENLEDGKHGIFVEAVDAMTNRIAFTRYFYVDTHAPDIEATSDNELIPSDEIVYLEPETDSLELTISVTDNFPFLRVWDGDDMVHMVEHDFWAFESELKPVEYEFDKEVVLSTGMNTIVIAAEDASETVTEHIYRFYVMTEEETLPRLDRIDVSGQTAVNAELGEVVTTSFQATGYDQYNNEFDADFEWFVEGSNVSILDGVLSVESNASGSVTVKVISGEVEGSIAVSITAANVPIITPPNNTVTPPTATPTVTPAVSTINVTLNEDSVELEVGTEAEVTTFDLVATVSSGSQEVVWTSEDDTVASVNENGIVTAVSVGTTTITATRLNGDENATAEIEVFLVGEEESPLGAIKFNKPYMNGYTDGTFRPEGTITRAELAVVFSKVLGLNTTAMTSQQFDDVSPDHWAYMFVQAAGRAGIFTGYQDGTFRPDQPINRAELAATFSKFWTLKKIDVTTEALATIDDVKDHWAKAHIYKLYNAKVLDASLVNFRPEEPATRGTVVVMVNKLLDRQPLNVSDSKFSDVKDLDMMGAIEAATSLSVE